MSMRVIDRNDGPEKRIPEPDVCLECGADCVSSINPAEDGLALDIEFTCGAVVRWKSVWGSVPRSESLWEVKVCPSALPGLIAEVMKKHPELRLGQLISNAAFFGSSGTDIFHIDNTLIAEGLRNTLEPEDGVEDKVQRILEYLTIDDDVTAHDRRRIAEIIREESLAKGNDHG